MQREPCTTCSSGQANIDMVEAQIVNSNIMLTFGKYKGKKTFADTIAHDADYVDWCLRQTSTRWPQLLAFQKFARVYFDYNDYWKEKIGLELKDED